MESILIIDDEQEVRELYKGLLDGKPYRIDEATNGQDALRMAGENRYDLYLTDIMMPRMSGFDFLKSLREIDPNAIVVIISGFDDIAYNRQALMYGAFRYLVKPVKKGELWLVAEQGLKERQRLVPPVPSEQEVVPVPAEPDYPDSQTFGLLARWEKNLNAAFYKDNAADFERLLFAPFRKLWAAVLSMLPPGMREQLECEKDVFEPIARRTLKGERLRPSYHGALVFRRGTRNQDGQLYLGIDARQIEFGFFVGEFGDDQRSRFLGNLEQLLPSLRKHVRPRLDRLGGTVGPRLVRILECRTVNEYRPMLEQWYEIPAEAGLHFSVILPKERLTTPDALIKTVSEAFVNLFPLVLLSRWEHPAVHLSEFLGTPHADWEEPAPPPPVQIPEPIVSAPQVQIVTTPEPLRLPEYPSAQAAADIGVSRETLEAWAHHLRRHGQAVIHALPGAGRTLAAEALARHLVGGSFGIMDVLPMHDAYTYPQFMANLLDFSSRMQQDPCVLILDDLHRVSPSLWGELKFLIDHRGQTITLAYESRRFALSPNLLLLGTIVREKLKSADDSLLRRTSLLAYDPDIAILVNRVYPLQPLSDTLTVIITELGLQLHRPGLSLYRILRALPDRPEALGSFWKIEVEPLLDLAPDTDSLAALRWNAVRERLHLTTE
jgi:5-methylcytosine-specific restriction protein B